MHILIAPNAFKHSLTASRAAEAIRRGLHSGYPSCTTVCSPVGDGGDGTGGLLTVAVNGALIQCSAHDPLGRPILATYGCVENNTAVIEMASASGINLLTIEEQDPVRATSYGTGELIAHALDNGAGKILLCIGGSATIDGGCGILQALGVRFTSRTGQLITRLPERLTESTSIDMSGLHPGLKSCELIILCDVTNPLLGTRGSVAVFGPQKGARPEQLTLLEERLRHLNHLIWETTGIDASEMIYGGAAGGVAAALCTLTGARAVAGARYFLDAISFDQQLEQADLVITGEGCIDLQTLEGKAPYEVAVRAAKKNVPVIAVTGKRAGDVDDRLLQVFQQIVPINGPDISLAEAIACADRNLEARASEIAQELKDGSFRFHSSRINI